MPTPRNKSPVYTTIKKVRYHAQIYKKARELFLENRLPLTLQNASLIWQEGCISSGRLLIKIQTWKYVVETFPCTEQAKEFIEKKTVFEASGKTYYRQYDRKIYHRDIFDLAFHLQQDDNLDIYDVKLLWHCTNDGRGPSKAKYRTLSFVLNEMNLTDEAKEFLREKVSGSFDRLARRAKRKSATPVRRRSRRRRKSRALRRKKCPNSPTSPLKTRTEANIIADDRDDELDESILDDELDSEEPSEKQNDSFSLLSPLKSYLTSWFTTSETPSRKRPVTDWPSYAKRQRTTPPQNYQSEARSDEPIIDLEDTLPPPAIHLDEAKMEEPTLDAELEEPTMDLEDAKTVDLEDAKILQSDRDESKSEKPILDFGNMEIEEELELADEMKSNQVDSRSWRYELPSVGQCLHCDEESNSIYTSDNAGTVYQFSFEGRLLKKIGFECPVIAIFHDDTNLYFIDDGKNAFISKSGSDTISHAFSLKDFPDFIRSASGHSGNFAFSTVEGDIVVADSQGRLLWKNTTQKGGHGFFVAAEADGVFHACGNILQKYDWDSETRWTYEADQNILDACMNKMFVYTSDGRRIDRFSGEVSWQLEPFSEFGLQASYAVAEMDGQIFYEHFLCGVLRLKEGEVSYIPNLENRPFHLARANDNMLVAVSDVIRIIDPDSDNIQTKECTTSDVELLKVEL